MSDTEIKMKKCDTCNGRGQNSRGQRCLDCMGKGEVEDIDFDRDDIDADDNTADSDDNIADEDEVEDETVADEDGVIDD